MCRKHHRRYPGRFTRLASLARSLTAPAAAGLLLVIAVPLVIMPMPARAQGNIQSATYRVTFEGKFTASALASGVSVPSGEHFTTLIGAVHNGSVTFWSSGGTASAGIESMAEVGGTSALKSEINASSNALAVIEQSIASGGTATATVDIAVTTAHPLVTLVTMIAPSPDWFVGVSGLSLRNATDDGWQPSLTVDLFPYDAGTEEGTEFSLNNAATSPQGTITSIKGTGKFSNEPIATLTFDLLAAPVITTTSPILVSENETSVTNLTATDDDTPSDQLTWTIPSGTDGGADADHFTLSEDGILAFSAAKDYENPDDGDGDGTYAVTVQVSDGDNPVTSDIQVTVTDLAPGLTGPATASHPEGRRGMRVAAYGVVDGDDWSLAGNDSALFTIADGFLRFVDPPDYENAGDAGNDNVYNVTVRAGDGTETETTDVAVTVTNVEEPGVVTLSPLRLKLDTPLVASLADPDTLNVTPVWQWERANGREGWEAIDGATTASYTPTAADADRYLRATATYTDGLGADKTAQAMAPHVVIAHRLSALTVPGLTGVSADNRAFYPAFDPDTLHYAARCTASVTLTLTPEDTDTRLSVNGVQRPKGEAFTVGGLGRESDIRITLTGAKGASTTYTVHCIDRAEFPKLTTVKADGATEDLMMFNAKWSKSSLIMMDNNGVPRLRKYITGTVWAYFRVFPDETHPRAHYAYTKGSSRPEGVEMVVLDKYFDTVDDDVHILSPFNNTDGHDQMILPNGDYVLLAYSRGQRDLSFLNAAFPDLRNGDGDPLGTNEAVRDSVFQVRKADGTVEFNWNAWDHMAIEDCPWSSTFPQEYGHINSLGSIDGDIIAGFRHCSKILRIDRDTGDVVWRAGPSILSREQWEAGETLQPNRGPAPLDFVNDPRGGFSGQHGGRMTVDGNLLVYDNATHCGVPPGVPADAKELTQCETGARGVEYAIDVPNGELVFQREFRMPGNLQGGLAGHAEPLDNGDWVISWSKRRNVRLPNTAVHVDAETDTQKLSMTLQNIVGGSQPYNTRVVMVSPVALAARVEPLEATIVSGAEFHTGTADLPIVVAFNRPVVDFDHTTPSLNVAGATVSSVSPHVVAGEAANAYVVTLTPAGAVDITFGLVADQPCADGGICTADGRVLSEVPASHAIRADTTPPAVSNIEISSNPGSDRFYIPGDEIQATVNFSETVAVTGMPQLMLELGGSLRTATYQGGTGTAALVFAYEVADGESDTDGVGVEADSLSGGTIRDGAGHNAVLDHQAVAANASHKVDGVRPTLSGAATNMAGDTIVLTYDEPLDGSLTPVPGDFTVSGGDRARTVTGVRVNGSAVELTLDVGAEHLEAGIQVSYTPGANPIQDVPGNDAEALSREPVTNDTPDTTSPAVSSLTITSTPGSDQTYAAGDGIEVTVTFDETVKVEGTPQLRLRVGTMNRTAGYDSGTGTAALVFAYEVADGDEDTDGVSIEVGRIALNGGTIEDEAENNAELDHEAVAPQAGHKVDGVRPELSSAAVDGSSLTLTYGEALDGGSRPAPGDYTVEVDGSGRTVSEVSVSDTVVTLTLDPEVEHGDTGIRVSYTPDINPIRDAVGNDALGLSNESVTNSTGAPNTAPQITSPSSFDVRENQVMVRRLVARDTDPGDEVTGWEIVGGADQGQFTITTDTGDLSFRTAPDFEAPGDNEHEVTVEVRSGAGARELEAEQTFTVRVTDEREPPGIPEAPTFSGETAESLQVSWSEPDNTGPAISDYDVQYREKGTGRFSDGQHEGPGLSLTLDDLEPGTVYEVQVRASNEEGTGDWSEPGEGMTVTPLTVQMTTDLPPPVEGSFTVRFSFSETVRGFTSSDIETQQDPACSDSANNPVSCNPSFAVLQTADDRIFTTTVTPRTEQVAHNYTLTITVPANTVTSVVGNKANEAAALEVRIAPPGVTVPISSIGLRANADNGQVTLRWNTPANTGGAAIVRYEYRWGENGGEFGDWMSVAPAARSATVPNLTNGTEYVFEVRPTNALGYGSVETTMGTPEEGGVIIFPPPPPPTGNKAPTADAGADQTSVWEGALVMLDGSGSSDPDGDTLRYRWNQFSGEPVLLSSQDVVNPTFTAPEGLMAEAVLQFRLLVTDPEGRFASDTVTITVDPEAEPPPAGDRIYYFPHLAVGAGWQTTITYINYSPQEVSCQTEFLSDQGTPLMVSFPGLGTVVNRTDVLPPGGSVHEETNVELSAPLVPGWARATCSGPLKASLLFRRYDSEGVPVAEAGVNAARVPATRFVTFAEQGEARFGTGVAYVNPSDTAAVITFTARDADGEVLASDDLMLSPNGHGAQNMAPLFGLTSFTGSLEVTSTEPIVTLSLNFEADPVFSSLPPGEPDAAAQGSTTYYYPHLAVGAGWQTTITYINYSPQEVSCETEFLSDHGSPLMVSFPELGTVVSRTDILPPGGSVHEETNVELSAPLSPGWAQATCSGPVKASLLFRRFEGGVPVAEAGVNAATVLATRFVTFAEQGEDKFGTGVAYANPSATSALVTFTAKDADGQTLASVDRTLLAAGHDAQNMAPLFALPSFTGSLEITSTEPIVSLSLNFEAAPVFSSLPPGELD